jgi:sec-independent protein translocase protein TatA
LLLAGSVTFSDTWQCLKFNTRLRNKDMFGLGLPEVVVISVVVLALFGAKKIPELGSSLGKTIKGFREELKPNSADPDQTTKSGED